MAVQPNNWNVVITGSWNLAILTPDGIRQRLFELPEGTPLDLEMAIDRPGRFRIHQDGVVVAPSPGRLEIAIEANDLASLEKASRVGQTALRALPETPVGAAGVNIGYVLDEIPDDLIDLLKSPIDDAYSDNGFTIVTTLTRHSLSLDPGVVNVELSQTSGGENAVSMNYHYASRSPNELQQWLARVEEFSEVTQSLLKIMNIPVQKDAE